MAWARMAVATHTGRIAMGRNWDGTQKYRSSLLTNSNRNSRCPFFLNLLNNWPRLPFVRIAGVRSTVYIASHMKKVLVLVLALACAAAVLIAQTSKPQSVNQGSALDLRTPEETHLRNVHQLTDGGENAEAYFSIDDKNLIFQSTGGGLKCDQIFTMNSDGTNRKLVSN